MVCPKCGFQQEEGPECLRCGIIIARYRMAAKIPRSLPRAEQHKIIARQPARLFRRFYSLFSWVSLAGLIVIIILIFRSSSPPQIVTTPNATQRAEAKFQEFQLSTLQGRQDTLEMDESELNGWLSANLGLKQPDKVLAKPATPTDESLISSTEKARDPQPSSDLTLEQAQSSVSDLKIELLEDSLNAYAVFNLYGMNLSLELKGRLLVRNGYLRMEPISGKLGSLPLLAGTLQSAASRLFDSPGNKENFRLPPYIQDVRIQNGRLIVTSR